MLLQALSIAGLGVIASVVADRNIDAMRHTKMLGEREQSIFYYDRGDGPALVLIHGMFGDLSDWDPILEPLSRNHRVIALDLPGFGASAKPQIDYTSEFFVNAIERLLQSLQIERATFVGNSFGGIICMLFALQHPNNVHQLVLIGSGGFNKWTEEERADAQFRFRKDNLKKLTPEKHQRMFNPLFVKGESAISNSYLQKQDAKLTREDFDNYIHALHSSVELALDAYLLESLGQIKNKTLLIQGKHDQVMVLENAQKAAQRFPSAELHVLPDCGHVPQLESGPEVVRLISEFVARV